MKDDISHRVTVKVRDRAMGVIERVRTIIPYGPGQVVTSPAEFRRMLDKATPQQRTQIAQQMGGIDAVLARLNAAT